MAQLTLGPGGADLDGTRTQYPQGTPAFDHVNAMQFFEYFNKHPNELELFAEAMRSFSVATGTAVAETYDFSGIRTLADIGGSQGSFCLCFCRSIRTCEGFCSICGGC